MYPYSILRPYRGSYIGTLGSKYILYGHMEPLGLCFFLLSLKRTGGTSYVREPPHISRTTLGKAGE